MRVSFTAAEDEDSRAELLKQAALDREISAEEIAAKFAPGTFGCHEALQMASVFGDSVGRHLCEHPSILLNPEWYRLASEAHAALFNLYQAIADEHLDAAPSEP